MEGAEESLKVSVSCVPGLEFITVSECNEVFGVKSQKETRGRVSFSIPVNMLQKLTKLRSVHHYWLVVSDLKNVWTTSDGKEEILQKLEACVDPLPWDKALSAFDQFRNFDTRKGMSTTSTENNDAEVEETLGQCCLENRRESFMTSTRQRSLDWYYRQPSGVNFRVTCSRSGKHSFTSMEAAKYIGSGVKGHFSWNVSLEKFDVEILAFIDDDKVTIAMKLSDESKHNRNITCFGPTTLRATTAFCLLKLAGVKTGDIVCDPMCGTAAISLEGVTSFPSTYQIGGENHSEGCENARKNFENMEKSFGEMKDLRDFSFPHSIIQWDARRIPLRDSLVDVVVCDMPFGKRIGYKGRNFLLYPDVLHEMARICRSNGKAVLLTQHKSAMNKTLDKCRFLWKKQASFFINMGGLNVGIYVLKRHARKGCSKREGKADTVDP
eukprot:gene20106-22077_t